MAIKVKNFDKSDVSKLNVDSSLKELFYKYAESCGEFAKTIEDENGDIIFCGGFAFLWGLEGGVAEIWINIVNKDRFFVIVDNAAAEMFKCIKKIKRLFRLQAIVKVSDDLKPLKFAKLMGFKEEGRMKNYYPDKSDAIMLTFNLTSLKFYDVEK